MNKKIIIGGILFILICAGGAWFFVHTQTKQTIQNEPSSTFPIGGTNSIGGNNNQTGKIDTTSPIITIKTASGNTVQAQNFFRSQETVADPSNPGYYFLGNHYPFDGGVPNIQPTYIIQYTAETQFFNISLLSEPISDVRKNAEQYLLNQLGISRDQLCTLNYSVSVPYFVNEYYTSQSLGFSFCNGSVPF